MSNLKQMLDICGTIPNAKKLAYKLINQQNILDVWQDLALLEATEGNYSEAIKCIEKLKDHPSYKIHYIYCMGYYEMLLEHDLLKGFVSMNMGRHANLWGNVPLDTSKPCIVNISQLHNKTIVVNMEAGYGDQIVFIRFLKDLSLKLNNSKIIVKCSKSLENIFLRLSYVDEIYFDQTFDCWIPSMMLPVVLETTFSDLSGKPYISSIKKSNLIDKYKYSIGLRWLGNPGDDYITRVFPEELLFKIFECTDKFNLYSLQKDLDQKTKLPSNIKDLEPFMNTWDDTISIIDELDLVITSCTSIAHIAGAMGKKTFVIIPKTPYYTWISEEGFTERTPWYDSVTLFQQTEFNKWDDVFDKIADIILNI